MKRKVAILFGGRSAEHEVSLVSARAILQNLDRSRFEPVLVGIDKAGHFQLQDESQLLPHAAGDLRQLSLGASRGEVVLSPAPEESSLLARASHGLYPSPICAIDIVFPVLHGTYGEDGTVQGLLELAGLPYVGAGVLGSAVGMDKDAMKRLLRDAGLPVVAFVTVRRSEWTKDAALVAARVSALGWPCFVKPANAGSSVGVHKVNEAPGLEAALEDAFRYDTKVVVERGVNAREIEVAVLGNDEPVASLPGEVVVTHQDGFYSYEAKYIDAGGSHTEIPAQISAEQTERVRDLAVRAFLALDGAGLARVDLFLDRESGELFINEINTLPGFTSISMYPKLWEATGLSFSALVTRLLDLAVERHEARKGLQTSV
jgi:D-alanine-D-alanine ligase